MDLDLHSFSLKFFPHYLEKRSSSFHTYLYAKLTDEINAFNPEGFRLAIASPRSHSKSSIVSLFLILWCICYNKKKFILLCSATVKQANQLLDSVKWELEGNERLLQDFPNIAGKSDFKWTQNTIVTRNQIRITSLGVLSKARGLRHLENRPSLIVCDDLDNLETIKSVTKNQALKKWYTSDLSYTEVGETSTTQRTDFFVIGTILSSNSLLSDLIGKEKFPAYEKKVFKAIVKFSDSELWDKHLSIYRKTLDKKRVEKARKFFEDNKTEMLKNAVALWPEGDSYYKNIIQSYEDFSSWSSEKQQEGVDLSKVLITKQQLHFKNFREDFEVIGKIQAGKEKGYVYGCLDPSTGKSDLSDNFCIVTIIKDPILRVFFVTDIILKRRSITQQVDYVLSQNDLHDYKLFGIETNAFQISIKENIVAKSKESYNNINIKEIINSSDKTARIQGIQGLLEDGIFVFDSFRYENNQDYNKAIEQLTTYTGQKNSPDDFPDCLEMCYRLTKNRRFRQATLDVKDKYR